MNYSVDVWSAAGLPREDVPEVDDDPGDLPQQPRPPVSQLLQQFDLLALLASPRQATPPVQAPVAVRARFSFIENRYGTRSTLPKRASKQTVDRLANPIHGFTSTLNALPPDVRKRRQQGELSLATTHPGRSLNQPPDRKAVPKKHQVSVVDRLSKPTFVRPKLKLRPNPNGVVLPPLLKSKGKTSNPTAKANSSRIITNQSSDKPSRPAKAKQSTLPAAMSAHCKNDSGGGFFLTQMDEIKLCTPATQPGIACLIFLFFSAASQDDKTRQRVVW
ncbi:hypothetical protein H310_14425 [Aphanomyces invadans]|uniref:Uncharacterized protein n=1 Tax=Aphanomyces invadans TaxID=157072 RepID=A0A024TB90_9STRA|nr:hypothetical protein H310_14425 [Aphanomyces invadans]ETV90866.1 hypothetical protein H310_14425 [Aphanomyces invadans]|eukprot:XP_008880502.1 hypothetical protein H310_14425 [Aphanomyces invadans]